MSTNLLTPPTRAAATPDDGFSGEQKRYLEGFFAALNAKGISFGDLAPAPAGPAVPAGPNLDDLTKEERIKHDLHPFDAIEQLMLDARWNAKPDPESIFRFKWNGLFWLSPVKDGYMCRLRIPGGVVKSFQLRELAAISRELTSGYIQITTRNNFQIRLIEPKNCPEVLRRIQSVGLHSKGAGADNIRNITMNPCAGYDPMELIDVRPFVNELATHIISSKEFYDLPRKFNIAFDGGGLVSSVEDTNDIGASAVEIGENDQGIEPGVWFRIALGGVTGHQTFASDWGVLVKQDELIKVTLAIVRVFIRDGDRTNRKKARLKYLLEERGFEKFLSDVEELGKFKLLRLPADSPVQLARKFSQQGHTHVGAYPQKQDGLHYIGASVPVGQMTAKQMERIADIADNYGTGEVRLTVWQNFIIPNIPAAYVKTASKALSKLGFPTEQSPLRNGFVACTGNRYCKFAASDTKGHAIAMMDYLDKRVKLDKPVNIHFTGCAHSCAQHFMGDVGLLGTKAKGESGEGYHITVGGGFGENRKVGRQIFSAVPFESLGTTLEGMLKCYLAKREEGETFHTFCNRHTVGQLQELFSNS
ncbi:NAD(P)H-dependent nitrite reductase catalytic subunit [Roseimicrobium gellanilyticum]|uniref:NAD(P)H-dependent nitrite reductase catalytic subunit n=1 Tax=Roseimicrobium gellanilyticum TaxID=748857 RepID=A0A366HU70_9BACT|nr:NirA family protein [Roseimicrobium gellanilyticum]RBP47637.1 NAD(P)H-dependent nitrite reductase catalytic subunit [Roseimicrobium gellanilyticum]